MVHKEKYSYEDFLEIIKALRAPDGCPWDREQTHDSLRPCMLEEAYEFLSSVRILEETGSADNMCEELGDLLLQIVMHAEIAGEEGLFTMDDVVNEISRKMVRRHPHANTYHQGWWRAPPPSCNWLLLISFQGFLEL